jgi:adenosylmethionine-8-amino-7-oxononanoate aminotransferase
VLTTDHVFDAFLSEDVARGFLHSHSYTGNAIACAAANEVLRRMETVLPTLTTQGKHLREAFAPLLADARIEHGRQTGMVLAFDVKAAHADARFAEAFHLAARRHELLIRPIGRSVYLMPPFLIDAATARWLADAVTRTLNDVCPV